MKNFTSNRSALSFIHTFTHSTSFIRSGLYFITSLLFECSFLLRLVWFNSPFIPSHIPLIHTFTHSTSFIRSGLYFVSLLRNVSSEIMCALSLSRSGKAVFAPFVPHLYCRALTSSVSLIRSFTPVDSSQRRSRYGFPARFATCPQMFHRFASLQRSAPYLFGSPLWDGVHAVSFYFAFANASAYIMVCLPVRSVQPFRFATGLHASPVQESATHSQAARTQKKFRRLHFFVLAVFSACLSY